jgi:hypothetical protein
MGGEVVTGFELFQAERCMVHTVVARRDHCPLPYNLVKKKTRGVCC